MAIKRTLQQWSVEDSTELYGIRNWGAGYFGVSPEGDVVIYPSGENKGVAVSVPEVIRGMRERGYDMPVLLRDHLVERIESLNGVRTVESAAVLGFGTREYELVEL